MRAAIYARVSTAKSSQDPEVQLLELREYCRRRGWEIVGEYVDAGVSGAREHRPELDHRYDRFARSLRQLVNALEEFRALGIDFVSLHEAVDTTTANGRLVFGIFATIAEFERELIRDRVRSGLAAARARGKRIGRPRKDLDFPRIARLRAEGRSYAAIATEMGVSVGTVYAVAQEASKTPLPAESPSS